MTVEQEKLQEQGFMANANTGTVLCPMMDVRQSRSLGQDAILIASRDVMHGQNFTFHNTERHG
jgi:hypothetical protein